MRVLHTAAPADCGSLLQQTTDGRGIAVTHLVVVIRFGRRRSIDGHEACCHLILATARLCHRRRHRFVASGTAALLKARGAGRAIVSMPHIRSFHSGAG